MTIEEVALKLTNLAARHGWETLTNVTEVGPVVTGKDKKPVVDLIDGTDQLCPRCGHMLTMLTKQEGSV